MSEVKAVLTGQVHAFVNLFLYNPFVNRVFEILLFFCHSETDAHSPRPSPASLFEPS